MGMTNFELKKGKTSFIAEIGPNHDGNLNIALELVRKVAAAGADAVKFQTFKAHLFLDKRHPKFEMYKSFELTEDEFNAWYKKRKYNPGQKKSKPKIDPMSRIDPIEWTKFTVCDVCGSENKGSIVRCHPQ